MHRPRLLLLSVASVIASSFIFAADEKTTTGLLAVEKADRAARFPVWTQSSLQRVFPNSKAGTAISQKFSAAKNQKLSFQICVRNETPSVLPVEVSVVDDGGLEAQVRRVGYVPVDHHTANTRKEELDGIGHIPGLVPEPLFPESKGSAGPFENLSFWISLKVPEDAEPGAHKLSFLMEAGKDQKTTVTASVDVRDVILQPRKDFPVTHWWRPDVIFLHYEQEPYGEEFFAMVEKYMRNMVEHGNNVMFVPSIEGRRETFKYPMQMLLITRDGDKWNFDFKHVRRLVRMGKELGFEYFEFPHLWLYWGVKHAVPIYLTEKGTYTRVWSADSDGFAPDYLNFMKQYLDALHAFLLEEGILESSFHHLSDEPNLGGPESIDRYERARKILHEYAPWMDGKVMDALSDINYAKKGITDIPIPIVDTAKGYFEANMPHWVYYCCGPAGDNLNRFMDTPLAKIRMSGWLFYRLKADGFLHWGYNYWHQMESEEMMDVYCRGDAKAWPNIPFGDPFVVYPGKDGPVDSVRWEVFAESLQDYALLQQSGVTPDDPLLAPITNYDSFPKTEAWLNDSLMKVLNRAEANQ